MIVRLLFIIKLFLCLVGPLEGDNLSLRRVTYASTLLSGTQTMVVDGYNLPDQCVLTNTLKPYVVIDLGVTAKVSSVVLWSTSAQLIALNGFNIWAMGDWRTCNTISASKNTKCGSFKVTKTGPTNVILNLTSTCTGRFIGLVNPSATSTAFTLCEMEVFGTKANPSDVEIFQNPYERQCGITGNIYVGADLALARYSNSSDLAGSEADYSLKYATDGVASSICFATTGYNNYFVLDLGAEVNISFVRIQSTSWDRPSLNLYDAAVTNDWQVCGWNHIYEYPLCQGDIVVGSPSDVWELKTQGTCIGRFFVFRTKSSDNFQWMKICEIEVYGTVTNRNVVVRDRFADRCYLTTTSENLALGKKSIAVYDENLAAITDGLLDPFDIYNKCFYSYWAECNYIIVDLGAVYNLQAVKIWNSRQKDGRSYTIDILVGVNLRLQYLDVDLQSFQMIGKGLKTAGWVTEVQFQESDGVMAQFIYIKKDLNALDSLVICELEVLGKLMTNLAVSNPRPSPTIITTPPQDKSNFPIMTAIRNGVSSVPYMQYTGYITLANRSHEGILWYPTSVLPYAAAGSYGGGKFVVFGKSGYFTTAINTTAFTTLRTNLYTFLSPSLGLNARIISSTQIDSSLAGDIVYFSIKYALTTQQQQKLLSDIKSGKVSVVLEMTYWNQVGNPANRIIYDFLLRELNVDFTEDCIYDAAKAVPISDNNFVNYDYRSIVQRLGYVLDDAAYLQRYGLDIVTALQMFPVNLMTTGISAALKAIVDKYYSLLKYICPGFLTPIQKGNDEILINVLNSILLIQGMSKYNIKAPCVDIFPGDMANPVSVSRTLSIVAQNVNEIHSTGLYLAAGQTLTYSTNSISGQWKIAVGSHTDTLYYQPTVLDYHWLRYPMIHSGFFVLSNTSGTIYSAFGGVVWIMNLDLVGSVNLQISNVVLSQMLNVRDPNAGAVWTDGLKTPSLWTELLGQYVVISAPSDQIRNWTFTDLRQILGVWDETIALMHTLKGTNVDAIRRERIAIDTQIAYGYGHAGYPIMVSYPWIQNIFNYSVISVPDSWGMTHELGHRRQQDYFTFTGTTEVTVNIFSDFIWNYKWGVTLFGGNHRQFTDSKKSTIVTYFANGARFATWQKTTDIAFMIYGQLGYHFGFGLYQKVFTNYTMTNPAPAGDQAIIDLWVTKLSYYSGYNVAPMFDFWGIPISASIKISLAAKPCFLPSDPVAVLVPDRYNSISTLYNNLCAGTPAQVLAVELPSILVKSLPNDLEIVN